MQKRILLIEDEVNIAESLAEILELRGYKVIIANDGFSGFSAAVEGYPDLIICDVMMPKMSGYEVLSAVRNERKTRQIPFVFLTARDCQEDFRFGMDLGADDYLAKPVESKKLYEVVENRLKRYNNLIEAGQREENERVSQDLHDTLQQTLLGLRMKLDYLKRKEGNRTIQEGLDESLEDVNLAFYQLRIILEENNSSYQKGDLVSGIRQIIKRISRYVPFEISLQSDIETNILLEYKLELFKVFFEILNNVMKHSKANKLFIHVTGDHSTVSIVALDDGCGFDIKTIKEGNGLRSMRRRVEGLGGTLRIDSSLDNGTSIEILIKSSQL